MSELFSNHAGEQLLKSLRQIFQEKRIFRRHDRFIMFVCGGALQEGDRFLRKRFIEWAALDLPEFVCLLAEEALSDSFAGEGRGFVNLGKFESVVADIADCVVIFPESPGSFAEVGFFANSTKVRKKTLVVNPLLIQAKDSFLNLGPIDTIGTFSFLKPTVWLGEQQPPDFTPIGLRLKERVTRPGHRERLPYQVFREFDFKQKLLVVFEVLRFLRLASFKTLLHALEVCFSGRPQPQELKHILRILLAAKFIRRDTDSGHFRVVPGVSLIEIEHFEVEVVFAQVNYFYQKYSKELYDALSAPGGAP